ncbi:helicase-related protein [Euzebya sp.]|uniref:helicase-related protein n=1 Tax=Euzebya sp. TaxID=1971409 RepID=UPI0035150507
MPSEPPSNDAFPQDLAPSTVSADDGYDAFLAAKAALRAQDGIEVGRLDVNARLHPWQREVVRWACRTGRAALFEDCGLGKTFQQVEWLRLMTGSRRGLIVAPLSVARQTVREAAKLGVEVHYTRTQPNGTGLYVTNYEMVDRFDLSAFAAVVLDESSILKNVDGKTRRRLTTAIADVPYRLACTATPAPNDVAELTNHADWLGRMARAEMLAGYFVHDDTGWRLKGHAAEPMARWMGSWTLAMRKPSDLGWPDDGYDLPPLTIRPHIVDVDLAADGQLFPTDLGGIGGRAKVRRETLPARCDAAVTHLEGDAQAIAWCGLNDEADRIADALGDDAVNVQGSWAPEAKAEALEAFQDGEVRVLITKPSIAGFGMNFQNAHRMTFVGLGDSYEAYYQAIRRCWRFGQTEPVDVHIVVSELEAQIVDNVRRKERDAASFTDLLIRHAPVRRTAEEVAA